MSDAMLIDVCLSGLWAIGVLVGVFVIEHRLSKIQRLLEQESKRRAAHGRVP